MENRNIIVIGASAGGLQALKILVAQLPENFPAAVFIVWHIPADGLGLLPGILQKVTSLPVSNARDGEPFQTGRIYIAMPDHHLLLEENKIRVTRGPKENRFRPSVDVLFRSAAAVFGKRAIGVVLTGMLDDGAAGLYAVKDRGGIAVVQDPVEAEYPGMPLSAMRMVKIDYSVSLSEMGNLLTRMVTEPLERAEEVPVTKAMKIEVNIANGDDGLEIGVLELGEKTSLTCPECHGALGEIQEGNLIRYRCHTGHAYSLSTLLEEVSQDIESSLWQTLSKIEETEMLLNRLTEMLRQIDNQEGIEMVQRQIQNAREKARFVRQAAIFNKVVGINEILNANDFSNGENR